MNILDKINACLDQMTKSEARAAAYCLGNLNDFAFDTLDTLAKKAGVSTTSVIRFCRRLGYSGFGEFQDAVRDGFKYQPSLPDKLRRTADSGSDSLLAVTLRQNIGCIERTFSELPPERLQTAIRRITEAKRVFTFGMKESFALAHYTYTRLLSVRRNVFILNAGYNGEIESVLSLEMGDVCVVFLFHRYTKQALQILRMLKKQGACVILVTSPPYDGVADAADILIPCHVDANSIKNTAAAPVTLADILCMAVASTDRDAALLHMKQSETLFSEAEILDDAGKEG